MTLKMTTAQVVETSVTVTNSSFQNYTHPDDHTTRTLKLLFCFCFLFFFCFCFCFAVLGAIAYWLFGYAFAFGAEGNGFIGHKYFALADIPVDKYSNWFFHFVFAATAATIVSGAMAERTEFKAYLMYSVFLTGKSIWLLNTIIITHFMTALILNCVPSYTKVNRYPRHFVLKVSCTQ